MGKGPKTPGWLEDWIISEWHDSRDKGKEPIAKEVRGRVHERLKKDEKKLYEVPALPSLRKVQAVLTDARRTEQAKPEEKKALDDPWSLGVSLPQIPVEATGDLLAAWRESLKIGKRFTIRQAIWVARLRSTLEGMSKPELLGWAMEYSSRERTAEARSQPMNTADLDGELAFQPWRDSLKEWEYDAAVVTGTVPFTERWEPMYIDAAPSDVLKRGRVYRVLERYAELWAFFLNEGRGFLEEVGGKGIWQCSWWPQAESVMVFWLRRISSKVKKWHDIDLGSEAGGPGDKEREEWETMGRRLATLVITQAKALEQYEEQYKAKAKEIDECIDMLNELDEQRRRALADKEARRWVPLAPGKGYILISPRVQELEAQIDKVHERLSNLPQRSFEVWKPTELLKEVGYEE